MKTSPLSPLSRRSPLGAAFPAILSALALAMTAAQEVVESNWVNTAIQGHLISMPDG